MKPIKYFQISVLTKMNFTDVRLLEIRERRPTLKEYSAFLQQLQKIFSDNSLKVLELFAKYDDGFFLPERCDAYEPIREKFEPHNLIGPIRWLSQPGGAVYFKKIKPFKIEGGIENHRLGTAWDENGIPLPITKVPYEQRDPYYLGEIRLFIDEKIIKLKSENYLIDFFNALYEIINGEYGCIKNPDGQIVLEKGELINAPS